MTRPLRSFSRSFGRLARARHAFVWPGLLALLLNMAVTAYLGIPAPDSHDERSYLLAADTFAHGRLTNPPHPMWEHLETFHVLHQPTYMSKYPPGQGLMLALGQLLTGEPIAGAWLSTALACAAITWALRAWLPARWALLAGFLAATHTLLVYWSQNYWGGSLAVAGGALLFGAIGRLRHRPTPGAAALAAAGVAVLLVTRPYEGSVLTLLFLPLLPWPRLLRSGPTLAAGLVVLTLAGVWLAYYNWRVTGSPLTPPFALYERQYSEASPFLWMDPRPPKEYRHPFLKMVFHDSELAIFNRQRGDYLASAAAKLRQLASTFFIPSPPALGLLALPCLLYRGRRGTRPVLASLVLFCGALTLTAWFFSHYAAPMFAAVLFLELAGLRLLLLTRPRLQRIATPLLLLLSLALVGWWAQMRAAPPESSWAHRRLAVVQQIADQPNGPHLVFVRYRFVENLNHDWVANPADIDNAPIVFARDMGPAKNPDLLRYYAHRTPWLLTLAGGHAESLVPYTGPNPSEPVSTP